MVRFLLIVVLVLAVLVLIVFVMGYNKIRSADIRVAEALSGIDVELTRRASLIPSLVHTVQTFATHEKGILDHVTDARAALTSATAGKSVAQRSAAERPNTTRSISELEPSRLAPCTLTQAASPTAIRPGTTWSGFFPALVTTSE